MKSLFLRLLVSLWLAMALLAGLLAVIHGWAFSAEPSGLRRRLNTRSVELRAESALACARDGLSGCEQRLAPLDPRDQRVAVYRSGALVLGEPIEGAPLVEERAKRSGDGIAVDVGEERELVAVVLRRDPALAAIATGPVRSPWMFFIVPETLPQRLLAIVAVTGLVAVLLARYLSRPVRILRGATQRMAAGDLSVRVSQKLAGADGETLALGRDMDRMAERIEELLETQRRLLRDVSHELRSPLARLNIALELVRRRSPPDVEPAFDRIERETERLNGMIGELLTLSRLESGRGMERTERFDLTALVEQLVEDAAFEAEQRGCSVELGARDACSLDGNEELLRRAIENVVRNAVRFTEAGTAVRIDLECSGGTAEVRVRDRGPGVPEGALADIWKPFYRVDDHRARGAGGTGIGLAITQRAVLIHGGEVEARNADGGGLEIALRLPVGAGG
ncbi:ATP-binding protein [Sorangium sp. So ce1000]|uniref:ATP-binding protein n=1 Tax=Sorangium sp. So ce1000 TaxID=3133325 RepID=UPI003F62CB5C